MISQSSSKVFHHSLIHSESSELGVEDSVGSAKGVVRRGKTVRVLDEELDVVVDSGNPGGNSVELLLVAAIPSGDVVVNGKADSPLDVSDWIGTHVK